MSEITRNVEMVGRFERHEFTDADPIYYEPDPAHAYYGEVKANPKSAGGYSFVKASRYTGVSTAVKPLDSDPTGLMYWTAKLDQIGIADLACLSLDSDGDLDWLRSQESIAAALREAGLTWTDVRDATAKRGTAVHEQIFLALATEARPPSLSRLNAEERAYGQAAMRWWRDHDPEPLYAEQATVCHDLKVAGRFDLLCLIDGERVLVDAKTREAGKARKGDHAQLEGYELCNRSCGIGPSDRRIALLLLPDGTYQEVQSAAREDDFLCALDAYRAGGDLGKRMTAAAKAQREAVPA